jgi:hypothetical protein
VKKYVYIVYSQLIGERETLRVFSSLAKAINDAKGRSLARWGLDSICYGGEEKIDFDGEVVFGHASGSSSLTMYVVVRELVL